MTRSLSQTDHHISRCIRDRRKRLKISQEQLATALGVSFQQVQKYEMGRNRIAAGRLYQIASALDVPIGYFFDGLIDTVGASAIDIAQSPGRAAECALLATDEGQQLIQAFVAAKDATLRQQIATLVETIVRTSGQAATTGDRDG